MAGILELLTIGVGTGIAKGVLKLWLQDNEIAHEVGGSIVDFIKSKTQDKLAIRKANRDFEELSEKVAKQLMPMFDAESENINSEKLYEIASLTGKTLDTIPITSELLAQQDLDPTILSNHFIESFNVTKLIELSDYEYQLYKDVIFEACSFIIDIASQLPNYSENTFSEVLKRENIVLSKVDLILEELNRIQKNSNRKDEELKFENEYKRGLIRRFDKVELFGVDLSASSKRYKLSVAYVSLTTEIKETTKATKGVEVENEVTQINELLSKNKNLIIRGIAGSGKTTLLKWILVQSASHSYSEPLLEFNNKVPFFIRLREFADSDLPLPESFVKINTPTIAGEMPDKWCHKLLREGRALVLIDGLDELQQEKRDIVKKWIDELVNMFPKSTYILSTRPYAAEEGWLKNISFKDAEIQDLKIDDIDNFIDHWHSAIIDGLQDQQEIDELIKYQQNLKETVRSVTQIRKLATNPLLCALICALHRERVRKLPYDRIELYKACTEMFFRRDLERKVALEDYPQLSDRQKRSLIIDLAYWLLKNNWSEIEKKLCDNRFDKKIPIMERIPTNVKGADIRKFFVERSGILRMPTINKVDFPHKTFQEFFAAQAILEEEDLGLLIDNANNDQWHEVVILATGMARFSEAKIIIEALIKAGNEKPKLQYQYYLLAASCLDVCVEVPTETKQLVQKSIKKILPPATIKQAAQISKVGEIVIPFLKYKQSLLVRKMSSSIRALTLIGTDQAHDQIQTYLEDKRPGLKDALLHSAKYTQNPEEFGKRFLTKYKIIRLLGNFSISLFTHCYDIEELNLDIDYVNKGDLTPLKDLKKLKKLTLAYGRAHKIIDFSGLNNLKQLQYLNLNASEDFKSLSDIKELRNLESLVINDTGVVDLNFLEKLTKLKYLEFKNRYQIIYGLDLTQLTNCKSLEKVIISRSLSKQIKLPRDDQMNFKLIID